MTFEDGYWRGGEVEPPSLMLFGGEDISLREYLAFSFYPEAADDVLNVIVAVMLVACGLDHVSVTVIGREAPAGIHVAALGLEDFSARRALARFN